MKFRSILMAATCTTLLLSSAYGFADHVNTDYNHQTDFRSLHTYTWGKVKATNPLNTDRIERAVNEKLQKEGWQELPSGGQVTIMATDHIHTEQEAENYYSPMPDGWGGGWGWGGWGWGMGGGFGGEELSTTNDVRTAHLVIDLFDTQSKKLLWRGVSRGELTDKPNVNRKRLYSDIDQMFRGFPPRTKH